MPACRCRKKDKRALGQPKSEIHSITDNKGAAALLRLALVFAARTIFLTQILTTASKRLPCRNLGFAKLDLFADLPAH